MSLTSVNFAGSNMLMSEAIWYSRHQYVNVGSNILMSEAKCQSRQKYVNVGSNMLMSAGQRLDLSKLTRIYRQSNLVLDADLCAKS